MDQPQALESVRRRRGFEAMSMSGEPLAELDDTHDALPDDGAPADSGATERGATDGDRPSSGPFHRDERIADRWTIVREIGRGASGTVYLAHDDQTDDQPVEVALKVIHRERCGDPQVFGRFRREAKILAKIASPHVVPILECTMHDDLVVLALEHARGVSLESMLEARRDRGDVGMPTSEAIEITRQIAEALAVAHEAGVVHRDLKPANVIVDERDGTPFVRILDFGLAKVMQNEQQQMTAITDQGMIFGTPEYMAPEQARGEDADARCDVYALGIVLYEMLSGHVPFDAKSPIATMTAHLTQAVPALTNRSGTYAAVGSGAPSQPPDASGPGSAAGAASSRPSRPSRPSSPVPRALEAVVMRALAKERDDRWPSARAMLSALDAAADERRVVARQSADALALSETIPADGRNELRRSVIMRAAAEHARLSSASQIPPTRPSAKAATRASDPKSDALAVDDEAPTARAPGGTNLWLIVAVLVAIAAVGLGAMFGAR
jgi:serine/threonine protein kinase